MRMEDAWWKVTGAPKDNQNAFKHGFYSGDVLN